MTVTSEDCKAIREGLGNALGQRLSQRDLGMMLGLALRNAGDTVRSWEDRSKEISGPAQLALRLLGAAAGFSVTGDLVTNHFRNCMLDIARSLLDDDAAQQKVAREDAR